MRRIFIWLLFLLHTPLFAQEILEIAQVDSTARPTGGDAFFAQFINANLRIPIHMAAKGVNARVYLRGVVESDGSVSGLKVMKGLNDICDQEAIRAVSLYKAWKPAMKASKAVRQSIVLPIVFKSPALASFDSTTHSIVRYYDSNWQKLETSVTKNRMRIPVDTFGLLNADVVLETIKRDHWSLTDTFPLKRHMSWHQTGTDASPDSVQLVRISASTGLDRPVFQIIERRMDGSLYSLAELSEADDTAVKRKYHLNGAVSMLTSPVTNEINREIYCYENGLLATLLERPLYWKRDTPILFYEVYDPVGNAMVSGGNGLAHFTNATHPSHLAGVSGAVQDKMQSGKWVYKSKNGEVGYEEDYKDGLLVKGLSYFGGEKLAYDAVETQPEYDGGLNKMYAYIGSNMKYPMDAARANVTGAVYTSFVVCEDGSLCDFKVVSGVYPSLDKEAIRVVSGMSGKWKPGMVRGRKVRVKYNMPIRFLLN